ncbi:unnamed protein product [Tenebrio molitor]|nr:unnamed protein product [Tenebrio molitor]
MEPQHYSASAQHNSTKPYTCALPHVGGLNLLCPFRKSRTATDTGSRDYHCVEYVFLFSLSNGISLRVLKRAFTICSTK